MKEIVKLSLVDQIALLKHIKYNYNAYRFTWSNEKVQALEAYVDNQINDLGEIFNN